MATTTIQLICEANLHQWQLTLQMPMAMAKLARAISDAACPHCGDKNNKLNRNKRPRIETTETV
jgi:hypothetical protein